MSKIWAEFLQQDNQPFVVLTTMQPMKFHEATFAMRVDGGDEYNLNLQSWGHIFCELVVLLAIPLAKGKKVSLVRLIASSIAFALQSLPLIPPFLSSSMRPLTESMKEVRSHICLFQFYRMPCEVLASSFSFAPLCAWINTILSSYSFSVLLILYSATNVFFSIFSLSITCRRSISIYAASTPLYGWLRSIHTSGWFNSYLSFYFRDIQSSLQCTPVNCIQLSGCCSSSSLLRWWFRVEPSFFSSVASSIRQITGFIGSIDNLFGIPPWSTATVLIRTFSTLYDVVARRINHLYVYFGRIRHPCP